MKKLTYGERLKEARKSRGLTQAQLAIASKVKQASISKIERGDQKNSSHDYDLASALKINPIWLTTGNGEMEIPKYPTQNTHQNAIQDYRIRQQIDLNELPLINWPSLCLFTRSDYKNKQEKTVYTNTKLSEKAFALLIEDDRYTTIANPGDYILFDPEIKPSMKQKTVLVSFDNGNNFEIWRYTIFAGQDCIEPISHKSEPLPIQKNGITIYATAVKVISEKYI